MKCIICDKETGSDKKRTCSGSCRAKASRMRNKTDVQTQAHAHAVYERDVLRTRTIVSGAHETMTPEGSKSEVPANYGLENCECLHCGVNRNPGRKNIINHGQYKPAHELADNEVNRVSLPGDVDYTGVAMIADTGKAVGTRG